MSRRVAIIGAGPIGLEAALAAKQRGFRVTVYEGGEVADSVKRWGHARMFSPFSMNVSNAGLALLRREGVVLPAPDAILTGAEFARAYLDPLARSLPVLTHTKVRAVIREDAGKCHKIREPERAETCFRLLAEHHGHERHEQADLILDCSGTFQTPNPLGDGGTPALGEAGAGRCIRYGLGQTPALSDFAGSRVLVAGGGHSAACLIVGLAALKAQHPTTAIHWVVRRSGKIPCARLEADPLTERDRICAAANHAAASGQVSLHDGSTVLRLHTANHGVEITLRNKDGSRTLAVDQVIAATGFRPDWSFVRELHLQTCWATEGTYALAASLLGEAGGDCLAVPAFGADTLVHPEPDFYALGMKSYGRTPDFLIATGLQQIESVMQRLDSAAWSAV